MSDHAADVEALTAAAAGMPHGPGQVALWEQAIAVADAHQDDDLGFALRDEALWPMYHGNRADLLLVTYAWCLAYLDRTPAADPHMTLWKYRWVISALPDFAAVTRGQIDAAWHDMKARYAANGYSARPVWLNRRLHLCELGDAAGAADAHRRYARTRPGPLCDDAGQDASFAVTYHLFRNRDAAAVAAGAEFMNGRIDDSDNLPAILNELLLPLARLGRWADGRALLTRAARLSRSRPQDIGEADETLTFLTATGDLAAAARHFDRHFTAATDRPGEFGNLSTYKHALFFARRLAATRPRLTLKVPAGLVPESDSTRVKPGSLRDWLEVELPALCGRADARNGNSYYTDRLTDLDDWAALAKKYGGVPA